MKKTNIYDSDSTGNTLCVSESLSISSREAAVIDRIIEAYEKGKMSTKDFISFDEFEKRIRRIVN